MKPLLIVLVAQNNQKIHSETLNNLAYNVHLCGENSTK